MFGGQRNSKSSDILRSANVDRFNSNASYGAAGGSVNDSLFQKIEDAEKHAKMIITDGQSKYVDGIKQNVIELVYGWLSGGIGNNIFTLFGKMGCGKSFFSARLYQYVSEKSEEYHTVAFSSQQIYRDTASVRNMLLSVAHQLFVGVPSCRRYFAEHLLDSESISALTESVLISPFEGVELQKPLLMIIDGLDEYPREDCVTFLETLERLRGRMNERVKIFFTSRPETYIMSEIACESDNNCYHIERNEVHSHSDCAHFVDVKSDKANVRINEDLKRQLVEKSECSLKYLDCFFNDIACSGIQVTADFIESLPRGLSQYYRDQLVRYFGDQNLSFYQTKIVPLLELLCVALRPMTLGEAADILGCKESDISRIISRSGTLLWKNSQYIMLYQSESIREFLMDERYCPERYRIDSENGRSCILSRLEEMIDEGEDIESNMYLFNCSVDHVMEQERISKREWALLVRMIGVYSHKADLVRKLSMGLIERSERDIQTFFQHLHASSDSVDELLQDAFGVRVIASAIAENRIDKLLSVLDSMPPIEAYDFLINYGRGRCMRNTDKYDEALRIMEPYMNIAEDTDTRTLYRYTYYVDEVCRIYRSENSIPIEENTRLHTKIISISEGMCRRYQRDNSSLYYVLLRNLSVSYDQLAKLSEKLAGQSDPETRRICAEMLRGVLKLQESDPLKQGFFLWAAAACYNEELRLSKICQQGDTFSDSRIYDLHYSFYSLGRLYSNKDFPGYNLEKAKSYYEDCLTSIEKIALNPESHERYIKVPIKVYDRLFETYMEEGDFEQAKYWLDHGLQMRERRAIYHPGAGSEFDRCYALELMATLVLEESGIDAAESHYLTAVRHYEKCYEKYPEDYILRAPWVVYHNMAIEYKKCGDVGKRTEYTRLAMAASEELCRLYPTHERLWDLAVAKESLSDLLRTGQDEANLDERITLLESAIEIYVKLGEEHGRIEKYRIACAYPLYRLFWCYIPKKEFGKAKDVMHKSFAQMHIIAGNHPTHYSLLDVPMFQFFELCNHIPELNKDEELLERCRDYMNMIDALTEEYDVEYAKCRFMAHEASVLFRKQGIEVAEQGYLDAISATKALIEKWKNDKNVRGAWYAIVNNYIDLRAGYRNIRNSAKARYYLQKAVEELDYAIGSLNDTVDLRLWRCKLYGVMADSFKDDSDVSLVSTAADLYLQQISQYIGLHKETNDEAIHGYIADVYKKIQNFLMIQETLVKFAVKYKNLSNELLKIYIGIILNLYTNLFDDQESLERVAYYKKMLDELD